MNQCWKRYLKWLLILGSTWDGRHGAIVTTKQQTNSWPSHFPNESFLLKSNYIYCCFFVYFTVSSLPVIPVDFIWGIDSQCSLTCILYCTKTHLLSSSSSSINPESHRGHVYSCEQKKQSNAWKILTLGNVKIKKYCRINSDTAKWETA